MAWSGRVTLAVSVLLLAVAVGTLVGHALTYLPFFPDDSFISLTYARRLANGDGLTWTDGARVEGYSNFLWVLMLGAIGVVSDGLVIPARVTGVVSIGLVLTALFWGYRPARLAELLPPVASSGLVVASGAVAGWSIGGLEHPLLMALVAWAVVQSFPLLEPIAPTWRRTAVPGVLLGLACLTRPDAWLVAAPMALVIVLARRLNRDGWLAAAKLCLPAVALSLAQLAFRLAYYDDYLPNTYYAKVALTDSRVDAGLAYILQALPYYAPVAVALLLGLVVAVADRARRARLLVVLLPTVVWLVYVVAIGGDHFPLHRHLIPVIVFAAFALAEVTAWAVSRTRLSAALGWVVAIALVGTLAVTQDRDPKKVHAKTQQWNWTGKYLGIALRNAFGDDRALLAVDAAGTLPYFARLPALDMLGLNDRYLAKHRPETFGEGLVGHELGDAAYVLRRKPDIIVFHIYVSGEEPRWPAGHELVHTAAFRREYQQVGLSVHSLVFRFWVRREGRAGVKREESRVSVPGLLFTRRRGLWAHLDEEGRLGVLVRSGDKADLSPLPLASGVWRVKVEGTGPWEVWIRDHVSGQLLAWDDEDFMVRLHPDQTAIRVAVTVKEPETRAHVRRITFERAAD